MLDLQLRTQDLAKEGGHTTGGLRVKSRPPEAMGVWGRRPQWPTNFYGFHVKNTYFNNFFIEREHAVCVVTTEIAKIFSQLMRRSLAIISERRLQPLLV